MNRGNVINYNSRGGVPHMRGDEPMVKQKNDDMGLRSPHAWGWTVVDKKIGNAFMLGGLTLLAADITKNLVSNAFPNLALSAYSHEFDDDMGEYMSEYMSESGEDDLGFISTGPIVGSMEYGETYDQDGLGVNDWDMDDAHAELIEIDEYWSVTRYNFKLSNSRPGRQ